jgi:hypothetical protein
MLLGSFEGGTKGGTVLSSYLHSWQKEDDDTWPFCSRHDCGADVYKTAALPLS